MVKTQWLEKVGSPSDAEDSMLDLNPEREASSRLACQIKVTDLHDGLIVDLPEFQF
jgi:2Fe-2S ferredoxin